MVSPTMMWRAIAWSLTIILAGPRSKEFLFRDPVLGVHTLKLEI